MKEICFSTVLPAYNREGTVARAIESALEQTFPPDEIVVVDDGSTDRTRAVVEEFGRDVRCISQPNAGAAASRNRGVAEAKCDWIAFLDSDDYWLPEHLARMAAAIHNTHGRADLYFSDMLRTEAEGGERLWKLCDFEIEFEHEIAVDASEWAMLPRQPMMLQSSVIRRAAYLDRDGMLPALKSRHDTHLFFRLCLGRAACAVAGVATQMTDDDTSGGRVTSAHGSSTLQFWEETEILYRDILFGGYPLSKEHRDDLSSRLAVAQLRLAHIRWDENQKRHAVGSALKALRSHPGRALAGLRRRLLRKKDAPQPSGSE